MERAILLTGVGGQSVQLAAQILARAATREGRHVLYLGAYGGSMRGGNTDSTVVVGDDPLDTPPIVSRAWGALAMHPAYFDAVRRKLAPSSLLLVNSSIFEDDVAGDAQHVFDVPATELATELGNALAASLVLLGAFAGLTGIVTLESLVAAMRESVPAYRSQHLATNERALHTGFENLPRNAAPAWTEGAA
ncbi:MAG: 2-oxoacid:acceptor oxidoreductase family protein [Myxococcota bacterium]|nr:2-oxoacid:acceptor oxidoreductase family protein [Myxococcota bacterium]